MIEDTDFETFLYISKNKYQIFVYDKNNLKNLYSEEINIYDYNEIDNFSKFFNQNILKIEKIVNNYIRNIILIIEDDKVFNVDISIKKKNYEKLIDQKFLENSLVEVKDIFRENYQDQVIMHMIIANNNKDGNDFLLNNINNNDDYFFLEINFISISNNFTFYFDKLLENHQIKINRYMSGSYIKSFFGKDISDLFIMANELNNGLNKNEIQLISKSPKNNGFFEKFFQLFS